MELLSGFATEPIPYAADAVPLAILAVVIVLYLAVYVYYAIALMTIARKIGTPNAWLAFIPFANVYLMWRMSKTPLWTALIVFSLIGVSLISVAGLIAFGSGLGMGTNFIAFMLLALLMMLVVFVYVGFSSWWWWRIAEQRGYNGAFGLLLTLPMLANFIPYLGFFFAIIPLIAIGILAWRDQP